MSKSVVRKAVGLTAPNPEIGTVIAFPAVREQRWVEAPLSEAQRWVRRDRRVHDHSCCAICGTGWGAAPGAAMRGATCQASACAACGSAVCQSHGLGNGRCPICLVGLLSGWGGNDKPCRYKGCHGRAVAADGAWHVCAAHLERRRPGYVAARLAERDQAWELAPPRTEPDFIAAVRAAGAGVYSELVERCRASQPSSYQDDDEANQPTDEQSSSSGQPQDRRRGRRVDPLGSSLTLRVTPPRKAISGEGKIGEANQPTDELRSSSDRRAYLTRSEVDQLCDAARKRGRYGHRDASMILVAYRHGLRVSELVALRWADVDLSAGRLTVRRLKGSDDSVQPLAGVEIRALRRISREQPAGTRHVFVSERGAPFTANGFFKMLSRAAAAIGMNDVHPHLLRHGCGFKLVNDGTDTRTLAAYLGHRNIGNTARYTKMNAKRFDGFWKD